MKDLQNMTKAELEAELEEVKEDLEETVNERDFSLEQTGLHVYAAEVAAQRQAWEKDIKHYEEIIANIEAELKRR